MIIRRKSRYILVESSRDLDMSDRQAQSDLTEGISKAIGHIGSANTAPKVMAQTTQRSFILRVSRGTEGDATMALAFVKELGGKETGLYTIRTSGSIKKLKDLTTSLYS